MRRGESWRAGRGASDATHRLCTCVHPPRSFRGATKTRESEPDQIHSTMDNQRDERAREFGKQEGPEVGAAAELTKSLE